MPRLRPSVVDHGDGADPAVTKVLLHFADEADRLAVEVVVDFQRVVDFGQLAGWRRNPRPRRDR